MQCALNRGVINPQNGHIFCDPNLAVWGFSLSIHRSNTTADSTISKAREILDALMPVTLLGEFLVPRVEAFGWRTIGLLDSLPKVEELQMDWLRSEDLNEERK